MLWVCATERLLVVRGRKDCVRGKAGLGRRIGVGKGIISGIGINGTRRLNGGEKLRGGLSIDSIGEGDAVVTAGFTL